MDISETLAVPLKPLVEGWGQERVAAVSDGLGETVLWSGSGYLDGAVDSLLGHAGLSFALAAVSLAAAAWIMVRSRGRQRFLRGMGMALALLGISMAGLLTFTGVNFVQGAREAATAYVLTSRRIVVLSGTDSRDEVQARDVRRVTPLPGGVRIDVTDGRTLLIRSGLTDRRELEQAAAAMAGPAI